MKKKILWSEIRVLVVMRRTRNDDVLVFHIHFLVIADMYYVDMQLFLVCEILYLFALKDSQVGFTPTSHAIKMSYFCINK